MFPVLYLHRKYIYWVTCFDLLLYSYTTCEMGLQPLEFSECLTDSPYFREKLHTHEKELVKTSKAIKVLISQCKDLLQAATSKR